MLYALTPRQLLSQLVLKCLHAPNPEHLGKPQSEHRARVQQHRLHPRRPQTRRRERTISHKVPGELGLSFLPRIDTCHTDVAFSSVLQPSCYYALQNARGGAPPWGCFWNWFLLWAHMSPHQLEGAWLILLAPGDHFRSSGLPGGRPDSAWDRWQVGGACVLETFGSLKEVLFSRHTVQDDVSLLGPHSRSFLQRGSLWGRWETFGTNAFSG